MNIGILSMQKVINYGSVLQAYSLREMIKGISGATAEFIDIKEEPFIEAIMPVQDSDDYTDEYYCTNPFVDRIKKFIMYRQQKNIFNRKIFKFWEDSLEIRNESNDKEYDLVFVGSDEVFKCTNKIRTQLYGKIDNAKTVVTYAASCGSAKIEGIPAEAIDDVKACVGNYSKISVRDEGTREYISNLYNKEIQHHLDPVLVGPLRKQKRNNVKLSNYMIVYAYNNRIRTKEEILAIKNFAKKKGLKTVCFGGVLQWCDMYIPASPFELLDYFNSAEYIVTDTFHGSIFSIINHKKFVSIVRKTNANKMSNLLADLKLEDRLLYDVSDLEKKLTSEIDYIKVDEILNREQKNSEAYIKECIDMAANK